VFEFEDGSPIFSGVRRVEVDEQRHLAFVTNLGTSRGGAGGPEGFIAVLDLEKRGAEAVVARVKIPGAVGAVGITVDEANGIAYAGSMVGDKLYKIDYSDLDASDPKNLDLNAAAVTELPASVGANARPTYSPELKRVYVSAYAAPAGTITVVDADPASASYGEAIDTITTGPTNSVAIDGERGLLYSANLGDKKVAVFDTEDHEPLLEVPTSGNAVNLGIDPDTREVWVSNFAAAGKTDVFKVEEVETTAPAPAVIDVPDSDSVPTQFTHSTEWVAGESLEVSGTGWVNENNTGSKIGVKLDEGDTERTTPVDYPDAPDEVWAVVEAEADGTWTAEFDFPSADITSTPWSAGESHSFRLLTGAIGASDNDLVRTVLGEVEVVAEPTVDSSGWQITSNNAYDTGVQNGYQLALDDENRTVYITDAKWRSETRNAETGDISVSEGTGKVSRFSSETHAKIDEQSFLGLSRNERPITVSPGTGKLVQFDAASGELDSNHSFLDLSRNDGSGKESEAFDWTGVTGTSQSSMRTTFSPYGVAVDGKLDGGTIVTTTARARDAAAGYGGNVVIYTASQGAPTDADRVFEFEDGTPIFNGIRRIAIDEQQHRAYITNLGNSRGSGSDGYITVLDLTKRGADAVLAQVTVPEADGAVGVTVDEENNRIYVGTMVGEKLYVIDGDEIDTSDPKSLTLNDDAITALDASVGANARPTYNAELKRVYVSAYAAPNGTITVVDADPESETYGEATDTIVTGPTNSVEIDGERGLLYSANLGDKKVAVFDTEDHELLLEVPTSGNAVNLGIDPVTRDVWVSNFAAAGKTDVITVNAPEGQDPAFTYTQVKSNTTGENAGVLVTPKEVVAGEPITISGTGWFKQDGTGGSAGPIFINQPSGGTGPVNVEGRTIENQVPGSTYSDVRAHGVWQSDDEGNWSITIPFPTPENSTLTEETAWKAGDVQSIRILTGSLAAGDHGRNPSVEFSVVAAPVVDVAPVVSSSPESVSVVEGASVSFSAAASGSPVPSVQWESKKGSGSWAPVAGATSTTLDLAKVTTGLSGTQYRAVFSNSAGSAESDAATLTVSKKPTTPVKPLPFTDVKKGDKFYTEIDWMFQNGLTTGVKQSDGSVKYDSKAGVSREAMAAFLYRLEGSPKFSAPKVSPFADLKPSDKFYKEITWLAEQGITTGVKQSSGKPKFLPKDKISREAMAAFMYRYEESPKYAAPSVSAFQDLKKGDKFYKEIHWMKDAGITTGVKQSSGKPAFQPKSSVTREAMAAFIYRLEN
jgi:6-phosphogluconolactonase (cycloisomerase 2 family)